MDSEKIFPSRQMGRQRIPSLVIPGEGYLCCDDTTSKTVESGIPLIYQGVHSADQNLRHAAMSIFYRNVVRTEPWRKPARGCARCF
jgi:hypothetical protein